MSKRRALLTQRGRGWGSTMSGLALAAGIVDTTAVKVWPHWKQILSLEESCKLKVILLALLQYLDAKHSARILP